MDDLAERLLAVEARADALDRTLRWVIAYAANAGLLNDPTFKAGLQAYEEEARRRNHHTAAIEVFRFAREAVERVSPSTEADDSDGH